MKESTKRKVGRTPKYAGEATRPFGLRLTERQHRAVHEKGGADWLRSVIDNELKVKQ